MTIVIGSRESTGCEFVPVRRCITPMPMPTIPAPCDATPVPRRVTPAPRCATLMPRCTTYTPRIRRLPNRGTALILVCLQMALSSGMQEIQTLVPVGTTIAFDCVSHSGSAVWIKVTDNGIFDKVLFLGENPVDPSVNLTKYGFKKQGLIHTLIIRHVDFKDAGRYKCSNILSANLRVVGRPVCMPSDPVLRAGEKAIFYCQVLTATDLKVQLVWKLGNNQILHGNASTFGNTTISRLEFVPRSHQNGKSLTCSLSPQKYWSASIAYPTCGFTDLLIRYKPNFNCSSVWSFSLKDRDYVIECEVTSNPYMRLENLTWLVPDAPVIRTFSFTSNASATQSSIPIPSGHRVKVHLPKNYLSIKTPTKNITLQARYGTSKFYKQITTILSFSPRFQCPRHHFAPYHAQVFNLTCSILASPHLPCANVSWLLSPIHAISLCNRKLTTFSQGSGAFTTTLPISKALLIGTSKLKTNYTITLRVQTREKVFKHNITLILTDEHNKRFDAAKSFGPPFSGFGSHEAIAGLEIAIVTIIVICFLAVIIALLFGAWHRQSQAPKESDDLPLPPPSLPPSLPQALAARHYDPYDLGLPADSTLNTRTYSSSSLTYQTYLFEYSPSLTHDGSLSSKRRENHAFAPVVMSDPYCL